MHHLLVNTNQDINRKWNKDKEIMEGEARIFLLVDLRDFFFQI